MNAAAFSGRVVRTPKLKIFGNSDGRGVVEITIAVDKEYLSKEKREEYKSQNKPTADFITIKAYGKHVTNYAENCWVGRMIEAKGRMENDNYEYEEEDGTKVKVYREVLRPDNERIRYLSWDKLENDIERNEYNGFTPVENDEVPF